MKRIGPAILWWASMAAAGAAQEWPRALSGEGSPSFVARIAPLPESDPPEESEDASPFPRSLAGESAPPAEPAAEGAAAFSIGPEGGYLRAKGAERGTWFVGAKARLHFARILAAEASITFHENRYNNSEVVVTQYPVQLTAFLYIIPEGPIQPYILGGVGWYYTRVDYNGVAALTNHDRTEHIFGGHVGAGAELFLSPQVSLDADVRYIFLNPSTDNIIHRDFNYWQIAFGLNLYF